MSKKKDDYSLRSTPEDFTKLHARATIFRGVDANHPLLIASPTLAAARADVLAEDDKATAADAEAAQAEQVAATKRDARTSAVRSLKKKVDYVDANILVVAGTSDQARTLGGDVLQRASYSLLTPAGVTVRQLPKSKIWLFTVQGAPGLRQSLVQISAKPEDESSWELVDGSGLTRRKKTLPLGVLHVRAAHIRGSERSDFTAPYAFTVK